MKHIIDHIIFAGAMGLMILLVVRMPSSAMGRGDNTIPGDDTTYVEKTKKRFFSGIELYVDYGKLLLAASNFESKFEGGINFRLFGRVALAGEFGYEVLNPLNAYDNAISYTIEGMYFRFGADYFIPIDQRNTLYGGLRYGASEFSDQGEFLLESDFWEDYGVPFGSDGLRADWFEFIFGSEMQLGKASAEKSRKGAFFLGWKSRFRVLMNFENREEPRVYAISGYGRTFDKTIPALNFYIKYRFGM